MAILPLFRVIMFTFITLSSLVVLGICAHIEFLLAGYMDIYFSFTPFGLAAACLTVISLPLFLVLGNLRDRVFTSMILFEIIWFFILWVVWVGTAGDSVAGRAYNFPGGCIYTDYPAANQVCFEFTVVEAFAFLNFFCAFIYYDVIFLYAIINAIRGQGVWTASVKEAANRQPGDPKVQLTVPVTQYQNYGAYPQQVPPQGPAQPYGGYLPQVPPQGPPAQPYGAYPQQVPQGPPPQQYSAYPQQGSPYGSPTIPPSQNLPGGYPSPGTPPQQVNYGGYPPSQATGNAPLSPQSNYTSYPADGSQAPIPLPGGYQAQPVPQQPQTPIQYGSQQPIPV